MKLQLVFWLMVVSLTVCIVRQDYLDSRDRDVTVMDAVDTIYLQWDEGGHTVSKPVDPNCTISIDPNALYRSDDGGIYRRSGDTWVIEGDGKIAMTATETGDAINLEGIIVPVDTNDAASNVSISSPMTAVRYELTDDSIRKLVKSGAVCEVVGHSWRGGRPGEGEWGMFADYHPDTIYRTCRMCGKCESRRTDNWE